MSTVELCIESQYPNQSKQGISFEVNKNETIENLFRLIWKKQQTAYTENCRYEFYLGPEVCMCTSLETYKEELKFKCWMKHHHKPGRELETELKHFNEKLQECVDQLQSIRESNKLTSDDCNILHDQETNEKVIQDNLEEQMKLINKRGNELESQAKDLTKELKSSRERENRLKQNLENLLQKQGQLDTESDITLSGCSSKENQSDTPSSPCDENCLRDYLDKDCRKVLQNFRYFHVKVMDENIHSILLDIHKSVQETTEIICKTFSFENPDEFFLHLPRTRKQGKTKKSPISRDIDHGCLQLDKTVEEQYDFSIRPYLLHLSKKQKEDQEETDTSAKKVCCLQQSHLTDGDVIRCHNLVAEDRYFYQMWTGIVQGACPINRDTAIKLAALLTQVYYGDKNASKPLMDYSVKAFLPKMFWDQHISAEVDKELCQLQEKQQSTQDYIAHVVEICRKLLTHDGIYYDVTVPKKSRLMGLIPRMRMKRCIFGISQYGVHKINGKTGEVRFTHRFSDIYQTTVSNNTFCLNFRSWRKEFIAFSHQSQEICDIIQLFISMKERSTEQVRSHFADEKSESPLICGMYSVGTEPNSTNS